MPPKKIKALSTAVQKLSETSPAPIVLDQPRLLISQLFPNKNEEVIRNKLIETGEITTNNTRLRVLLKPTEDGKDHEIVAMATGAIVSHDPGLTRDYINTIQDYTAIDSTTQLIKIRLYWNIYQQEGLVNNSVNKIAAIISGGGEFKVRAAKKGRKAGALDELKQVLYFWQNGVNAAAPEAVVTGSRGLQAIVHQGVRQTLVEGDWFGRTIWNKVNIPNFGTYSLPMNIQTLSTVDLEPVTELAPIGAELYYWVPPSSLIQEITSPSSKEIKQILQQLIPKDILKQLNKDQKALLDPALLMHAKFRGRDNSQFGESFIAAAMQAIAYKRAIDQLDITTMQNVINRLTIVMVGSKDPNSAYSKNEVAMARASLLQQFFQDPGPNMTIIWAGQDIDVKDIGAQAEVLNLDNRHHIGESKIKQALGVPEALLSGTTSDGKSAGFAAIMSAGAGLEELQNQFEMMLTTIGERIANENNFTDVDLVFEFSKSLLIDKVEAANQTRLDYTIGLCSIRDFLTARDKNPDAVFMQKCLERGLDPDTTTWEQAFNPPAGLPGQTTAPGTPTNSDITDQLSGRPNNSQTGDPTQQPQETKTPIENK